MTESTKEKIEMQQRILELEQKVITLQQERDSVIDKFPRIESMMQSLSLFADAQQGQIRLMGKEIERLAAQLSLAESNKEKGE